MIETIFKNLRMGVFAWERSRSKVAVKISGATKNSAADKLNIAAGSRLLSVNGHAINDMLDYGFYTVADMLTLEIECGSETKTYTVSKGEDEELGIESESFLMDEQHRCQNNCIFCFIDQLPAGLRETLYFKDDDERLSFLFGNYITLTNLGDAEIQRIIDMKISPVNISVHTTNPELRCRVMGNRFAGQRLEYLYRLAEAGVELNCQIVLCRDINDGTELETTLKRLIGLYPSVQSIACVPAGLTSHREGLPELIPYDRDSAVRTLDIIERCNKQCRAAYGVGLVYPSDEFFLLAGREIPELGYYDDLRQLENGVGMLALFKDEFLAVLEDAEPSAEKNSFTIVTGVLAAPAVAELAEKAKQKRPALDCEVVAIKNDFLGGNVTVAGLLTAKDIYNQLKNATEKSDILITECMLRSEGDMFLDSVTVDELSGMLGRRIIPNSGGEALAGILLYN